jgi:hypothetical protein
MDFQAWVSIVEQDRECCVACSGADFENGGSSRCVRRKVSEEREFLEQPLPVFEEIRGIVAIE